MTTPQRQREAFLDIGGTSELLPWDHGRVLKLCFDWVPPSTAEREFRVTRAVHALGLPVPAAHELVRVDGRCGIVFERIEGPSLYKHVEARPWRLFAGARQLAELHAQSHALSAPPDLPSQRDQINRGIAAAPPDEFSETRKEVARRIVAQAGEGNALCHGDFHPGNILLTRKGPIIIDWSAGTRGHPEADVARTRVLFERANLPAHAPVHMHLILKVARRLLHATYLNRYLQLRPGKIEQINLWLEPQRAFESAWRATNGLAE